LRPSAIHDDPSIGGVRFDNFVYHFTAADDPHEPSPVRHAQGTQRGARTGGFGERVIVCSFWEEARLD